MKEEKYPRGIEILTPSVILNDKEEVLLVNTTKDDRITWQFVGGHVEPGEKIAEASIREAKEETGLNCEQIYPGFKWFKEGIFEKGPLRSRNVHYITFPIIMKVISGEMIMDASELNGVKWVPLNNVLEEDLTENARLILEDFIEYRKNN